MSLPPERDTSAPDTHGERKGPKQQALVVADDPVYLSWLRKAAGERVDFSLLQTHDVERVMDYVDSGAGVDLLFCEFTSATAAPRTALVARMQEQHWQVPVVGLGAEENTNWVLAAMRAGARDFLVLGRDDETVAGQISRLVQRSASTRTLRATTAARSAHLFTVLGSQPSEGNAFVGEHLALALNDKIQKGERAILVDLSAPAGAASVFLNLNPSYSVLDAIRDGYRCDETLVDAAFSRHASGLYVLSLPEDHIGPAQFEVPDMLELFDVLGKLFVYVVVAADGFVPVAGLAGLIERSQRVLMLSDQSILKSRHTKHLLRRLKQENCTMNHVGLVVDNYRRRLGLEPGSLAELFELPLTATLTNDSDNRSISMNSGEPMFSMARKDPFCLAMRELADQLCDAGSTSTRPRHGLFGRLKS